MKLVHKLTVVVVAAMVPLLSVRAWYRIRHDTELFLEDMKRDHRVVGSVMRSNLVEVRSLEGTPEARRLIEIANRVDGGVRFEYVRRLSLLAAAASDPALEVVLHGQDFQRVEGRELVSLFPVTRPSGEVGGALRVTESLAEVDRQVRSSVVSSVAEVVGLGLLALGIALASSRWFVGKPVERLVSQARRVGQGDLSQRVELRAGDELEELAREMNAMCEALARANEKRAEAIDQLHHAERLATVGKLSAGIAHELGTPLSVVAGHAQMIALREVEGEKAIASATAIEGEVERISRIVRQLMEFARAKRADSGPCDAAVIVGSCVAMLGPIADQRRVHLSVEAAGASLPAAIGGDSLTQVVANLIVNAIDASPGGSVRVRLGRHNAAPPAGAPAARDKDHFVRIEVEDDGSGIAPEVLPRIFEPFFTTKEPGKGTGLGLSVAYGMVHECGGWISVDTAPTRGTTFFVWLPVVPA